MLSGAQSSWERRREVIPQAPKALETEPDLYFPWLLKGPQMYWLKPITKYYLRVLESWKLRMGLIGLKSSCWQGHALSRGSERESICRFLALPASSYCIPWLGAASATLESSK